MDFFANTYSLLGQMCTDNEKKRDQKFWCVRQEKREALRFFCQKRKCFQWRRVKNELYWCRWLIFLLIFYLNVIFEKKQPICLLQPMLLFLNSIPPQKTLMNTPSRQFQVIWNFWLRIQNFNVQFMTKKISICYFAVIPLAENFLLKKVSFLHHIFPLT